MHGYPYHDTISVSVSNRKIPIRIAGRGQPLLLLHGYPLNSRMWDRLVPLLAADHLCIVPDMRGFGQSAEENKSFSLFDLAEDCDGMLNVLQIRQPVAVCGLSMGGYIAMQLVERHALSFAYVILTNTRANADDAIGASNRRAIARIALTHGVSKVVLPMLDKLFSQQTVLNEPQVVESIRLMMLEARPSSVAWAQLAMSVREDFRIRLKSWKMPVVCVAGAEDTITPPEVMQQMASEFCTSEMHIVANSAHLTPLERPTEFAKIVRAATSAIQ